MQKSKRGAMYAVISVPTRYIHSPVEMVNINDVRGAIDILKNYMESKLEYKVKPRENTIMIYRKIHIKKLNNKCIKTIDKKRLSWYPFIRIKSIFE